MGIEQFEILKTLGEGAFASVHKVTRRVDGKTYALKKVDVSSLDDKELLSALNEIRLLASFAHPRIVRLYETFLDGSNLCIVMEYCGWGDLAMKIKRYIKRREYIDERVIWVYLIQILEGLKALHERNVLHRDLKPANCFLAEDGSIKIGDMNVSKVMKDGNAKTQIGTPYYMSPEIWARRPYNHATDIWSLGCLIYELCALRPPFLGNNMSELKTAVLGGHFNPVPSVYSNDLGSVIARMLTPAATARPSAEQALAYPEVHARKCLVKNVLREDDLASLSRGLAGMGMEDALMPTIHIGSLRELGLKLPVATYPTDGPLTPTTPVMLAHDASPVNEEALLCRASSSHLQQQQRQKVASASPSNRRATASVSSSRSNSPTPSSSSTNNNVIHRRQPSTAPVNLDKDQNAERASPSPPVCHIRRASHDAPRMIASRLPHASGANGNDMELGQYRRRGASPTQGQSFSRPSSVKNVLVSAQKEVTIVAAPAAGESPYHRPGSLS
ncbi:Hypothetical protein NocV09_02500600 [Nannochloropsis oceanica]